MARQFRNSTPIVEELHPVPDPWNVVQRLSHLPHLLFLDSADHVIPSTINRYSFVAADPERWISGRSDDLNPITFESLYEYIKEYACDHMPGLPPFQGGMAGLFGYDLCHLTEKLPRAKWDEFRSPDLAVGVYKWVIAWDHVQNRAWWIGHGRDAWAQVRESIENANSTLVAKKASKIPAHPVKVHALFPEKNITSNFSRDEFEKAVACAVEYTHAGDCFQVNMAQRLLAPWQEPLQLYGRLRQCNPAPFAGYLDMGEFVIASASPERFLGVDHSGRVETRPIKGTRAKRLDPSQDEQLRRELLSSPKDRAENVMIVDLLRNDLGKVCQYGSIHVNKVCELETYRTVHHLVSEVIGQLRAGTSAIDLLKAAFPGGSITGAPKVRAMEIIAELEPTARGPYCGSLGYLGFDRSMDTNILIRTFTLGRGYAQFPVGAGIVADSDPATEYDETLAKAEGLIRALIR